MKRRSLNIFMVILILILAGCKGKNHFESGNPEGKTRNIILLIGDGMGVSQINAGMTISKEVLALEKFPFSGLSKTYSANNYITDSGAGGTAIACGIKTKNGMIGFSPDSTSVSSIMEYAHQNGFATGLVSTSGITHATPASFVAHNSNRNRYEEIAKDFLNGTIDLFIGGGENHFRRRADSADLTVDLKDQGFDVVYTLEELINSDSEKIAGLLAKGHMPKVSEGREGVLEKMTLKAIETLSKNEIGFILMVEGSMIDWGGHDEDFDYVVSEMIDFDDAIRVAMDYAESNDNTLVIVTSDHETGGLALTGGSISAHKVIPHFSCDDHTGVMVPIFSYGPGAEKFSGIHENTFFLDEFLALLDIKK